MTLANDPVLRDLLAVHSASARLGILGGGQLARMTGLAALSLGCEVRYFERTAVCPAAGLAPQLVVGDWADHEALAGFAAEVDVITIENEFIDAATLRWLEECGHQVFPTAASLALIQDKLIQKQTLVSAGLPVAGFRAVSSIEDVHAAARDLGWPLVLKTRRDGYDGKGNFTLNGADRVAAGWSKLGGRGLFVEAFWPIARELAVIVTSGRDGTMESYPVVETIQRDHICHAVEAPAAISPELAARATALARRAITVVGGIGSFGVELFLSEAGEIAINELAPRVHNSGHYTLEACACSQFENHVRAVLGWPLGSPRMTSPAAVMLNLLGAGETSGKPHGLSQALCIPDAHVHLYGKARSGAGRKMGHVTAVGATADTARAAATRAAREIYFGDQS
jgi:5-(carboxyamino)imidazole ribonucleotide synthase